MTEIRLPRRSYTVTVTATDAKGESASTRVDIAITDVTGDETDDDPNNAPVFVTSATDDTPLPSVDRRSEGAYKG